MKRKNVLHFGTNDSSFQTVMKRYAADYGLGYDSCDRGEVRRWRKQVVGKLDNAAFVFIWNGLQHQSAIVAEYCRTQHVPHCFIEYGMLPQRTTFFIDPDGFCGRSRLCKDLSWVTRSDMERLQAMREKLQAEHPLSDNGDVLVPMQIFADTQIMYNTHWRTMQGFVKYLKTIFHPEQLVIRPHPDGGADYDGLGVRVQNSKQVGFLEAVSKVRSVVGLTSTTLMEAVVLGKPVMALGDCALRGHCPEDHDRVAAGALAMTIDRQEGRISPILERFGLRPLCSEPIKEDAA
ncbi:MAG: capsular polysaccharide export protein, LipB/KpsS family [Phycisphaerales bacterium]